MVLPLAVTHCPAASGTATSRADQPNPHHLALGWAFSTGFMPPTPGGSMIPQVCLHAGLSAA